MVLLNLWYIISFLTMGEARITLPTVFGDNVKTKAIVHVHYTRTRTRM